MKIYIFTLSGATFLIFLLFLNNNINYFQLESYLLGLILNLINSYLAYFFFKKSLKKQNKQFMVLVFGGMSFRLFLLLLLFALIIIFLKIDIYAFIFTFLILYFISLTWEISIYLKETKKIRL
jgi:hypothetical protein